MKRERVMDYVPFREALPGWEEHPEPKVRLVKKRRPEREDPPRLSKSWCERPRLW